MNRIKILREENGIFQKDLAKLLGVSIPAVNYYENEKRAIDTKTASILADYFNVSIDYLMGKSDFRHTIKDDNISHQFYMMPVYGRISAGQPNWAEECIEGRLPVDPELMGIINPEEHYFLKVNGESMNKIIRNGAFALIHKQDSVENGEIAVVLVNGDNATLKKFTKQGDVIVLTPDSTDESIKQQIYTKDTPVKIIGKYIGKMEIN